MSCESEIFVTRSDKISLIAAKYTHSYYTYGVYCILCHSNSTSLLNCLGFPAYMVKFVLKYCAQKELLNLLLAQNTIMYTHANNLTIYACR